MKRIFIALCAVYPLFAYADIIATFNNGNIEDVTVVSIGAEEVVYNEGGTQKSIVSSQVEGVLYDDGRFVAPPKYVVIDDSYKESSDHKVDNTDISEPIVSYVLQDEYLICAANSRYAATWEDLVILDMVVKPHEKKKMSIKEEQEYIYFLCIMKEDFEAYNTYLKGHKEIKKLYQKACKERSYDFAQPAAKAYKAKKDEGASGEEAVAAFINTYIEAYNQSTTNPQ